MPSNARMIANGAIALALIMVSFLLFRGTTNILNGITVPLIMALFFQQTRPKFLLAFLMAFCLLIAIAFPFQLIFSIFYAVLALVMVALMRKKTNVFIEGILLSLLAFIGFLFCLWLTDVIFSLRIQSFFITMLGGSTLRYVVVILFQGIIAGSFLTLLFHISIRLLKKAENR